MPFGKVNIFMLIKKRCLAAAAALCAVMLTACGNDAAEANSTAAEYTEITSSAAESVTDLSETAPVQSEASAEAAVSETEQTASFSCADITSEIENSVELSSMAEVGADRIKIYLDFDIPEGCDFSMLICGSGGFADEVFVINAADIDVSALEEAVEKRIESRKKDFEGYNPDEYDKLENFYSKCSGDYFMYVVTGDNSACEKIFDEYVK